MYRKNEILFYSISLLIYPETPRFRLSSTLHVSKTVIKKVDFRKRFRSLGWGFEKRSVGILKRRFLKLINVEGA